jgi:plastocyanin
MGGAILAVLLLAGTAAALLAVPAAAKPRKHRTVRVEARDNEFEARRVTVRTGMRVKFVNVGRNQHNVIPTEEDDEFLHIPTRRLEPDDAVGIWFNEPGKYRYYCSLHGTRAAGMRGVIVVKG